MEPPHSSQLTDQPDRQALADFKDLFEGIDLDSLDFGISDVGCSTKQQEHSASDTHSAQDTVPLSRPDTPYRKSGHTKATKSRLPRSSVQPLKEWFDAHVVNPYAADDELLDLTRESGLSITQVRNWLANKRRRLRASRTYAETTLSDTGPPIMSCPLPITHPHGSFVGDELTPMERWRNSPPEEEAVPAEVILQAVSARTNLVSGSGLPISEDYEGDSYLWMFLTPSVVSSATSQSSEDHTSGTSRTSSPAGPMASRGERRQRQRRRRRTTKARKTSKHTPGTPVIRPFQCTFCTATFGTKHDWARHEKSLHLPLDSWVCSLQHIEPVTYDCDNQKQVCAFCSTPTPSKDHLSSHDFAPCTTAPLPERSFTRKDHLQQHLRNIHRSPFTPAMELWRPGLTTAIRSRCGFCHATLVSWSERQEHLAEHFRQGSDMRSWLGDWGFDPHIEAQLEQAMPPYVIGLEQRTMLPFIAQDEVESSNTEDLFHPAPLSTASDTQRERLLLQTNPLPEIRHASERRRLKSDLLDRDLGFSRSSTTAQPTPRSFAPVHTSEYGLLENELAKFFLTQRPMNANWPPSDKEIQSMARVLTYSVDDPVDWTFADHPEWLRAFRQRYDLTGEGVGSNRVVK